MESELVHKAAKVVLAMQRQSWEQGVVAQAFFEAGMTDMAMLMVEEAIHRQTDDGRLGLNNTYLDAVDCGANGLPAWYAHRLDGGPKYGGALDKMAKWFLNAERSEAGIPYHNPNARITMIDGVYHMAPMMVVAGYPDEAIRQIDLFYKIHQDPKTGLFFQLWDDDRHDFVKKELWTVGIAWMAGALSLVLAFLDETATQSYRRLKKTFKKLIDDCLVWMRDDGLYHDIINRPETYVQTTPSIMIAYAIYRAVQGGFLERGYLDYADKMYDCVKARADSRGFVNEACSSPNFDRPGVSAETQGFFIMCHAARNEVEMGSAFPFAVKNT